jgi:hypothetical protein
VSIFRNDEQIYYFTSSSESIASSTTRCTAFHEGNRTQSSANMNILRNPPSKMLPK